MNLLFCPPLCARRLLSGSISVACTCIVLVGFGIAENWPQWRGPAGNGISHEKGLPLRWSHTQNVEWKIPLPDRSGSTPIVWGNRVFLNVASETKLYLWCLDRGTGKNLWSAWLSDGDYTKQKHNMSSPSPVTDGKTVWVLTGTGHLRAFDMDGQQKWHRDIQADYGAFGLNHGYASSPLLHRGTLFVQVLHGMHTDEPSYLMAVDGGSGKTLWRQERPTDAIAESPDSYSTPSVLPTRQGFQIVISGGDYVTGHDSENGREMWRLGGLNPDNSRWYRTVASTLVQEDMVFVSSRVKPFVALQVMSPSSVRKVWSTNNGPDVPSPVHDGRYLYLVNDKGIIWCLQGESGEIVWGPKRLAPGTYSASPVLADGRIYVTSEDGVTSVVRASEQFEHLAENTLEGYTLSSLAVSDGQFFIRTASYLYCVGDRHSPTD